MSTPYTELAFHYTTLHGQVAALINHCAAAGIMLPVAGAGVQSLSLESCLALAAAIPGRPPGDSLPCWLQCCFRCMHMHVLIDGFVSMTFMRDSVQPLHAAAISDHPHCAYNRAGDPVLVSQQLVLTTAANLQATETLLHGTVTACLAGAVVRQAALPAKLNVVVQPLMGAVRKEPDAVMQRQAAAALADLVCLCLDRKPSPNDR